MRSLPSGTVTFLFTDIEGSTKLAQQHTDTWESLRARHHAILNSAIESNDGYVFQIIGDAFCAAFYTAGDALRAAVQSQIELFNNNRGETPIKVRMGIHTGKAELQKDGQYRGYLAMSRIQRLMSAGHGGQVLISLATEQLVRDELPKNVALRDMGNRRFKDLIRPERIHQLVIANLPADFPPLKTLDAYQHNLPVQLTSFIGRENEMANIAHTIKEHRLVTLTGVGGTGKTRLALQVAADLLDEFSDGVWFVELAPVTDPDLIPQTVVSTLQLHELPGRTVIETITDFLGSRKALLLLDNCEHLIQECAEFSHHLLQKCTKLKILTTSRELLGIMGEVVLSVSSLSIPHLDNPEPPDALERFESVKLFVDRVCTVNPIFELNPTNASSVAQICSRLDGIPLALELAAARVRGMGVDQIASRLDHRFRLLTGGSRTSLPRQQTLGAMVDWSFNLLTDVEKQLFQMLAVFIGPFTLQAVEEVCRIEGIDELEVLDLIQRLVEKSLVITEERYGETYYRQLETIRQYGRDKLLASEKAEPLVDHHAKYFMKLANQGSIELRGPDQILWTHRFIMMRDNLRAALEWVIETGETDAALLFVCYLHEFWLRHADFQEARGWLSRIVALPNSHLYPEIYVEALNSLSWISWLQGRTEEARTVAEQALTLARSQTNNLNTAEALLNLGMMLALQKEDIAKGKAYIEESRDLCQETQDEWVLARALMDLAVIEAGQKHYDTALSLYSESFNLYKKLGDKNFQCLVQRLIGNLEIEQDNQAEGVNAFSESLIIARAVENNLQICYNIWGLAQAAISMGYHIRAVQLFIASKKILESIAVWRVEDDLELEEEIAPARTVLSETEFQSALEVGQRMTMEQAIEYALEAKYK